MHGAAMAKQPDYLPQLLNNIQEQLRRLEAKQDSQTEKLISIEAQTLKTNGRVTRAESTIERLDKKASNRFNISPNVIYLIALAFVLILAIIAAVLKVDVGGVLT